MSSETCTGSYKAYNFQVSKHLQARLVTGLPVKQKVHILSNRQRRRSSYITSCRVLEISLAEAQILCAVLNWF
jgi:hypothetical protein